MNFRDELEKLELLLKAIPETDKKILDSFSNILKGFNDRVEEIEVNIETLQENVEFLNSDLSEIQDDLFEEVSLEDLEDFDEGFEEVTCSNCNKPIFIEKSALINNEIIPCPFCGESIE